MIYSNSQEVLRLFLLAFTHAFLAPIIITPSTALLLRVATYNLDASKGFPFIRALGNSSVMATFWGIVIAQILLLGSIYSPILYNLCIRPHLWCILFWPYLLSWAVQMLWSSYPSLNLYAHSGSGAYITDRESDFNLFLQSFLRTIANPIALPSPVFSRVLVALLFRYADATPFIVGTLIGCLGGHFMLLLISCLTIYVLARSAPERYRGFVVLYYDFFRYFSFLYIFFSFFSEHGSMLGLQELPLVQLDSARLRDVWPNIFFYRVTWTRPFWYPIYREAEGVVEDYIAKEKEVDENKEEEEDEDEDEDETKLFDAHPSFIHWRRFSQFFFNQCAAHGKLRLSYNYPESVGIANDTFETALDLPFSSQHDPKLLAQDWRDALIQRRDSIYLALRSRIRAANLLRKPFDRVTERKQQSLSKIVTPLTALIRSKRRQKQYENLSPNPLPLVLDIRLLGRLVSINWIDMTPNLLWRLDPTVVLKREAKVNTLAFITPLSPSIIDHNSFKDWIEAQSRELNHSLLLPWQILSEASRKRLPKVMTHLQAGNATQERIANIPYLSWEIFVDLYEHPKMPQYPPPDAKIDIWRQYFYLFKQVFFLYKDWILLKLKRIEDVSQETEIILELNRLHKTFPFLTMRGFQMTNQQRPEPEIGFGYLPVSQRFNKKVSCRSMITRRRNLQAGNWLHQRAPLAPLLNYWWQKIDSKKSSKFSLLSFIVSLCVPVDEPSPKPMYFHNKLARYIWVKLTKGTAFDDLSFLVEIMNRVRGPWLIMVAYFRRYIKLPTYIVSKHLVRTLLRHESELEADLSDWHREKYIICDFAGKEPVEQHEEDTPPPPKEGEESSTDSMKGHRKAPPPAENPKDKPPRSEWPETWWGEGLQFKILNPVRLKPWRVTEEDRRAWIRMDLEELVEECREEFQQNLTLDLDVIQGIIGGDTSGEVVTFLGIWGQELEHPGGEMVKLPDYWAPIIDSTLFLIRLKLSIVWHAIKALPVWKFIASHLTWAFKTLIVLPLRKMVAVLQASIRLTTYLKNQLKYYVHQASGKLSRWIPASKTAKVEVVTSPKAASLRMVPPRPSQSPTREVPKRPERRRTSLENYLYRSSVIRNGLIMRFALLEPLPRSAIKSVPPNQRLNVNLRYKWLQLKILWIQIRKCLIFFKTRTSLALKVDFPIWLNIQLQLFPIRMKHLGRRVLNCFIDVFDWFIDSSFEIYHQLNWRYLVWRFGPPEPTLIQADVQARPFELTLAYMLHKLWESKRKTCQGFTSELETWEAKPYYKVKRTHVEWWNKDRILAVCLPYLLGTKPIQNQGLVWSKRQWMIWLRNTPHYAPPKVLWNRVLKLPAKISHKALCQQIRSNPPSSAPNSPANEWTLSTLHKRWVQGAKKWARRYRWFKLIKQYTTIGYEGGQHRNLMFTRQVALPTYVKMFGHFQLGQDSASVRKQDDIDVNDDTDRYFLFAPHEDLFNESVPDLPDDLVDELITIGRDYPYWFRQGYRSLATSLYNLVISMPDQDEELNTYLENTPSICQRLALVFKFFYGQDFSYKSMPEQDLDSMSDVMGADWTPKNWCMHLMDEKVFIYNFLAPLFILASEKASPRALGAFYHGRIQWLLQKTVKIKICRLYDQMMLPDTQREFRVLTLLNLKKPLPPYTEKQPRLRRTLLRENDLLERFLWPSHRFENLACMNRFWLGTANQSKFSMLRIRMYPLVKP